MGYEGKGAKAGSKGNNEDAIDIRQNGSFHPFHHGRNKKKYSHHSHKGHLETYIEEPLGIKDEQDEGCEYQHIDVMRLSRDKSAQTVTGEHNGGSEQRGIDAYKQNIGPKQQYLNHCTTLGKHLRGQKHR